MDSVNTMTYSELYDYLQEGSDSGEAEESDSISEYFTNEQLDHIRQALGIPDNLSVDVEVGTPSYWEGGGMDADEKDEWIKQLEDQMLTAASELDFEKAAKLRDQLFALRGDTPIDKHQPSRRRRERMRKAEH